MYRQTPEKCAQRFSQLLTRLGYVPPPVERPSQMSRSTHNTASAASSSISASLAALDPKQWEWIFADLHSPERNAASIFLLWLCDNLTMDNVLTREQLDDWEELQRRGMHLEGEQLEHALRNSATSMKDDVYTMEQLRQQMNSLSEELVSVEERLERKKCQQELMLRELNESKQRLSRLSQTTLRSRKESIASIKRTIQLSRNRELNTALEQLSDTVARLIQIYKSLGPSAEDASSSSAEDFFFAGVNLQQYIEEDRRFTKQLTEFSTKQFELQKQVRMLEEEQDRDPEVMALVQGLTTAEHAQYTKELERLQVSYKHGEEQLLIAMIEAAKAKAELDKMVEQNEMTDAYHQMDMDTICGKIATIVAEVEQYKTFLADCMTQIPGMLQEMSELQSTSVLEGSYDLRLARQDYHLSKQDRMLHHLLSQKSRHEFLVKCFEAEEGRVRFTHNLLEAIQTEFETMCVALNRRMNEYSRLVSQDRDEDSGCDDIGNDPNGPVLIRSCDTLLHTIHDILSNAPDNPDISAPQMHHQRRRPKLQNGEQSYITSGDLLTKIENVTEHRKKTIEADIKFTEQRTDAHIDEVLSRYKNLEKVLFAKSATFLQPWLIPSNVEAAMRELDEKASQLEERIKCINDNREQKMGAEVLDMLTYERKQYVKRIMSMHE